MAAPPQERHNTDSLTAGDADGAPITRSSETTKMREIREEDQEDQGSSPRWRVKSNPSAGPRDAGRRLCCVCQS